MKKKVLVGHGIHVKKKVLVGHGIHVKKNGVALACPEHE